MTPDSTWAGPTPTILTWHVSMPKGNGKEEKEDCGVPCPKRSAGVIHLPEPPDGKCWGSRVVKSVVGPRSEVTTNSECLGKCAFRRVEHDMLEHDTLQEVQDPWNFWIAEWVVSENPLINDCFFLGGCWLRGGGNFPKIYFVEKTTIYLLLQIGPDTH